jgi:hypothetical protein
MIDDKGFPTPGMEVLVDDPNLAWKKIGIASYAGESEEIHPHLFSKTIIMLEAPFTFHGRVQRSSAKKY